VSPNQGGTGARPKALRRVREVPDRTAAATPGGSSRIGTEPARDSENTVGTIRLFRHYVRVPILVLMCVEALVFAVSVYVGAYIRFFPELQVIRTSLGPLPPRAAAYALVMVLSLAAVGLYHARYREGLLGVLLRVLAGFALGVVVLVVLFYVFPSLFLGRGALALTIAISLAGILAIRGLFFGALLDPGALRRRVLVLGAGAKANSITRLRRRADQRGFRIVGFVHVEGEQDVVEAERIFHPDMPLAEFAARHRVDEIVVAVNDRRKGFPLHELLDCRLNGIDVVDILTFFERETGKVRIDLLNPSWLVFSDGFQQSTVRELSKRFFDVVASLLLLALTWPVMLIAAAAVYVGDRGPVFYRQIRVGQDGKPFHVLKFRSMRVDAEAVGGAQWAGEDDPRITRVGRILRHYRIDELPQILNVLRGDMSFVGPRPERPEFVTDFTERLPYYAERHRVKPGITGWAQLCFPYGASERAATEKLQYDLYYVKNHSLLLDILILLQTAEVVLFGKGAR